MSEVHIPGQTDAAIDGAPEPTSDAPPAPVADNAPPGDTPPADPKPGDEPAPEPTPKDKPEDPPEPIKNKRSIYDDLKDEKRDRKAAEARMKELEEENARLKSNSPPPPTPPQDELDAFAQEQGVDRKTIERLAEIVAKRIPQSDLTKDERQQLTELKTWQEGKMKEEVRAAEDREIIAQSTTVKAELQIHDDAELQKVMDEIVKLAHTERFHDKEVGYIIWANKDALSKLISPKKPSFENGGQPGESAAPGDVEFSGKMTPAAAQKAVENSYAKGSYEIRRAS